MYQPTTTRSLPRLAEIKAPLKKLKQLKVSHTKALHNKECLRLQKSTNYFLADVAYKK